MQLTTPPLSPKIIHALANLNIYTQEDIQECNPCRAFLLLKKMGLGVTKTVFWQLVALSLDKAVSDLNNNEREYWLTSLHATPPVALFPTKQNMVCFMQQALIQAQSAADAGEVPVGAVVVYQNQIIAQAHNSCIEQCDVSAHAEISALRQAGSILGNYRLHECDLYVSLEPCIMCASAILQARIARLIFAATEPKTGAAGSILNLFAQKKLNNHTAILSGILADESRLILQNFFALKRV